MASVFPFQGYRPPPRRAADVCVPPYDTVSDEEARRIAVENPDSFIRVVKPEVDLPPGTDPFSDAVYARGAENLDECIRKGLLRRDPAPAFYIYRLAWNDHAQDGVVATAAVDDYDRGVIKRHETTRPDREEDRTRCIVEQRAHTGPVFLFHRRGEGIEKCVEEYRASHEPHTAFTSADGTSHSLWTVDDPETIRVMEEEFRSLPCLYLADGHHRACGASRARRILNARRPDPGAAWHRFLVVIFPAAHVRLYGYNRLVTHLNGLTPASFIERLRAFFDVSTAPASLRPRPGEFRLFVGGEWYALEPRRGTFPEGDPVKSLDVSILHDVVLSPLLGVGDIRRDETVRFVGGTVGHEDLVRMVRDKGYAAAFVLHPPSIDDLVRVADAGKIMPPKSTWFYPKPYSGLVVHAFDRTE